MGVENSEPEVRLVLPEIRHLPIVETAWGSRVDDGRRRPGGGGHSGRSRGCRRANDLGEPLRSKRIQTRKSVLRRSSTTKIESAKVGSNVVGSDAPSLRKNVVLLNDLLFFFGRRMDDRLSCLLYTSPSPRDLSTSRMPSSA